MLDTYEANSEWANGYKKAILAILAENAFVFLRFMEADQDTDRREATDYTIEVTGGTLATRIRSADRDFRDLTLRTSAKPSELDKIRGGFARWYLYCWTSPASGSIVEYVIVDLDVCRSCGILATSRKQFRNGDGTHFVAINVNELRTAGCVVVDRVTSECPPPRKPGRSTVNLEPQVSSWTRIRRKQRQPTLFDQMGDA